MLFKVEGTKTEEIKELPFQKEKNIQNLFEENMDILLGYQFLESEFRIGKYRLDSVAFNRETNSFVIVEFKKVVNYSLVDQGFAYLKTLIQNKAAFVLIYNHRNGTNLGISDFDWGCTKIAFVSPEFSKYQIDAVSMHSNIIELFKVTGYGSHVIVDAVDLEDSSEINLFQNAPNVLENEKAANKSAKAQIEHKQYDLEYLIDVSHATEKTIALYEETRERILEIYPSLKDNFTKLYTSLKVDYKHNLISFWFKRDYIEIVLTAKCGEINDAYGITTDIRNRQWPSAHYAIKLDNEQMIEQVVELTRQTYNALKYTNGEK